MQVGLPYSPRSSSAQLLGVCLLGGALLALSACSDKASAPRHQTVAIAVLPDTPPPPPPKEDKPPPPKEEPKQTMQMQAPKMQAQQAAPQQLKMEGAAGDGPSAFGAGAVNNEYAGGAVGDGTGGGPATDRAEFSFFIRSAKQQLKSAMEQHLKTDAHQLVAVFSVWLSKDGEISRYEVQPTGSAQADAQIKAALADSAQDLHLEPPANLPQPMKFRLTLHPLS